MQVRGSAWLLDRARKGLCVSEGMKRAGKMIMGDCMCTSLTMSDGEVGLDVRSTLPRSMEAASMASGFSKENTYGHRWMGWTRGGGIGHGSL